MRTLASISAFLTVLAILMGSVPVASAETMSDAVRAAISGQPKVGVKLDADRSEANPGDDVRYWIKVVNLYDRELPQWKIAFFFDPNQVQILESSGGRLEGDHITFNVPASRSGDVSSYSVRVHLYRKLAPGEVIRTYASMIWDGEITPACSKHELRMIENRPLTGAGDNTSTVENLGAFLRPMSAASQGSPMPLMVWALVALVGVGVGSRLGKRFA